VGSAGGWTRACGLAAILGALSGGVAAAPTDKALTNAERKTLADIGLAAERGDCAPILKRGVPLIERRQQALSGDVAASLYELIANCHLEAKRDEQAYAFALRGTALDESTPGLWYVRLGAERTGKRYAEAVATLEAMAQGHGAALNGIALPWMWTFLDEMKKAGAVETRMRALKLLAGGLYAPEETFGSNDDFRFLYAQELLVSGDAEAAGALVRILDTPENIARASVDPQMRLYLPAADVRAAAEKHLARHREWVSREPDALRPLLAAAANLRQLGRAAEALELLRSAEKRVAATAELMPTDTLADPDHVNWWWNDLAKTYEALGRVEEAVDAYRQGMATPEDGAPNVSQLINLALAQNRFGRHDDALATLATRDLSATGASPYGIMLYRRARACAHHLSGRAGAAAADVEYVRSHEKDAPAAATNLFLCLGDLDAAAASVLRRLDDPELRADMLLELADYDPAPAPLATDVIARNLEALKKRADVQAAIARAGGTRRFNVQRLDS
jgi:tetratricopeptide (TPR) repeat protein